MLLYLSVKTANVSVTSKAHVGNNGSTLCSEFNLISAFATSGFVNEIVDIQREINLEIFTKQSVFRSAAPEADAETTSLPGPGSTYI